MAREHLQVNRFGFAEYEDMIELAHGVDAPRVVGVLSSIVELVLAGEDAMLDSLSDGAQADFVVPLGMCARMFSSCDYSPLELVSAACTVRYSAESHMSEFSDSLARMLSQLPR